MAKKSTTQPFRISRAGKELGVIESTSPLAALKSYSEEKGLIGVQQGRATMAVTGFGLLRAESIATCSCGPRALDEIYWDADNTCRCRSCRLPVDASRTRDTILSEKQLEVLRFLCATGKSGIGSIFDATKASKTTLSSLVGLGLLECRTVGARGAMYHLTKTGKDLVCKSIEEEHTKTQTGRKAKEDKMSTTATAPKKAGASPFAPLFKELLGEVKKTVKGTTTTAKKSYTRISVGKKTVAYVNQPTSKGIVLTVPKAKGVYDSQKVTSAGDVAKAVKLVERAASREGAAA